MMANWHSVLMLLMLLLYFIFVTVSLCQLSSPCVSDLPKGVFNRYAYVYVVYQLHGRLYYFPQSNFIGNQDLFMCIHVACVCVCAREVSTQKLRT